MPLELFPYQIEGANFLAQRERAGLFDDMGVGKTPQAIRALDLRRLRRGIVICPAMLRANWVKEFRNFAHVERRIIKAQKMNDFLAWSRGHYDTMVLSYEMATRWLPDFYRNASIMEFCIIDEGHFLKNPSSKRSKAIVGKDGDGIEGVIALAVQTWWLTGTPIPNDPADIYTFLKATRAITLSEERFVKHFFHSRPRAFGFDQTIRAERVAEIRSLIGNNALRRTKEQAGLQLPPIFLTSMDVDGNTDEIRQMIMDHPGLEQAIIDAVEAGGISFIQAEYIATLRRLIGEAKAVPYAQIINDELDHGLDKIVIMGIHRAALTEVQRFLSSKGKFAVLVNGDTPEAQRVAAVEAFQSNPACRAFIGNIRAAGQGLTLTAAAALDMLESDWTPAGNAQAIMRVHRVSQTRQCRARFITLANSIDEVVNATVARKTAAIAEVQMDTMIAAPPLSTA